MGATRIYVADSGKLPAGWQEALPYIARTYRERATGREPEENRRAEFLAGLLLAQVVGVVADEQLLLGTAGKPALISGGPSFNLSHGGNLVVLAVSEETVGIDVERISDSLNTREHLAAKRVCTPAELNAIECAGDAAPRMFALRWTEKEAVLKAKGCGFEADPRACPEVLDGWITSSLEHDGHMITVAQRNPFEPDLIVVREEALVRRAVGRCAIRGVSQEEVGFCG